MVSQMELDSSLTLLKFISDEGLVASDAEEEKRKDVVDKLEQILIAWIKRVAYQRRLPPNQIKDASVTILPYGSYGLGVYNAVSNIDILCVGPCFASIAEDFFIVLHNMLAGRSEVYGVHCVKDAKVPLLRFTFEGIMIDLSFAKLQVIAVPENVDISNPSILQLVPDVKAFQELLRCVKLWAKRRGVYSDLFGFFGGTHLAILAALICEKNPSASLLDLISMFFKTFAFWPWPEPVILEEGATPKPPPLPPGTQALMPFQLPGSRNEYCYSNMTTSTFNKIRSEFRRGYRQTQLEELHALCDPNPTEYIDLTIRVPNVVFYWGLVPGRGDNLDLNAATNDLMTNLSIGYQGNPGRMTLTIVHASQLSNLQLAEDHIKMEPSLSTFNHQQQMMPVYSTLSPHYVVGYLVTEGNPEDLHANGLSVEF
nr:nuclear poly(A) polymerase 3 [Tanacetum cinerariifolium]